jgi:hypothetical protein
LNHQSISQRTRCQQRLQHWWKVGTRE